MVYIIKLNETRKGESFPFQQELMWACSLEESKKLREKWLSSQPEEEQEYFVREAEILMPHPEKPGVFVNHLHSSSYEENCYFNVNNRH